MYCFLQPWQYFALIVHRMHMQISVDVLFPP